MRKKIKRTTKQYIIVAMICTVVIGCAAIVTSLVFIHQIRSEYSELLRLAYNDMDANKRDVYIAQKDIKAGEFITTDILEKQYTYSSQPKELYIEEKDMGKLALVDIPQGTHLMQTMLTDQIVSSEIRELEYNVIHPNSNIMSNDTVDIRITYPNGESYIVLAKKDLKGYIPELANCFFWMTEEEILRMSAAIVDAGLYPGSILSMTKYIEPAIQEESVITYTPSLSILSLLEQNPNIVERYSQELNRDVRKALENRMAANMAEDVATKAWNVKSNHPFVGTVNSKDTSISGNENKQEKTKESKTLEETKESKSSDESKEKATGVIDLGTENSYLFYAEEEAVKKGVAEYGE